MKPTPYINWMQRFTIYETHDSVYIVASDTNEKHFRVMKVLRTPVDSNDLSSEPTLSHETEYDKAWRLNIQIDPYLYTGKELACFLSSVKAGSPVGFNAICNAFKRSLSLQFPKFLILMTITAVIRQWPMYYLCQLETISLSKNLLLDLALLASFDF